MKIRHDDEIKHLVQEFGITLERAGLPRMAGKIFGHLILSRSFEVSATELATALHASRGSVSTMTRLLIQQGLIDKVGRPGDRKDYFRLKSDPWTNILRTRMEQIVQFHNLIERGFAVVSPRDALPYTRLKSIHELYEFMELEFAAMLQRWERRRKRSGRK